MNLLWCLAFGAKQGKAPCAGSAVLCVHITLLESRVHKEQTSVGEEALACGSFCGCVVVVSVEMNFFTTRQN